jgi:HEPN domain-containing protein
VSRISDPAAWVQKADHDLLNIQNNLLAVLVPWDTVCFHAQQAGEKLLKGYLVAHGMTPERTHDLVQLLSVCLTIDPALSDLETPCVMLSAYGVFPRYPDDVDDVNESDARSLVAAAEQIRGRIVPLLALPDLPDN